MKKRTIIATITAASVILSAFSCNTYEVKSKETPTPEAKRITTESCCSKAVFTPNKIDLYYGIGTRFRGVTKGEIQETNSFLEYLSAEEKSIIKSVESFKVILVENDIPTDKRKFTEGSNLTKTQKELLLNADYSTNFLLSGSCQRYIANTTKTENSQYRPHFTIVPEVQATYQGGFDALINYLKENSASDIKDLDQSELKSAKIYFTVTKNGKITEVIPDRTTGDPEVDKKMLELITNIPENWTAAQDENGTKVDQQLVFTFGIEGC